MNKAESYAFFLSKGYTQTAQGQWSKGASNVVRDSPKLQEQQDNHQDAQEGEHEGETSVSVRANDKKGIPRIDGQDGKQFQITAHFYFSDNRGRDGDGAYSTAQDVLRDAGAIIDDKWQIIPKFSVECFPCSKGQERVEVTIEELE